MPNQKRIVLTGGPGTGKTSLLEHLKQLGYSCQTEYSRTLIQEELAKGSDVLPWANLKAFSEKVLAGRIKQFELAPKDVVYFDRGIPDILAYMHKDALPIPLEWETLARSYRYDDPVFIAPPWEEIYTTDSERKESFSDLIEIHSSLLEVYTGLGYSCVELPKVSVAERVDFVVNWFK